MIPIVEELLENIIKTQLALFKDNPTVLEKIFNYSNSQYSREFRKFVETQGISVIKNFPRISQKFPCYCIMLGEENENVEALGQYLETSEDEVSETNLYQIFKSAEGKFYFDTNKPQLKSVEVITNLTNGKEIQDCSYDSIVPGRVILNEYADLNDTVEVTITYTQAGIDKSGTMFDFNYRIECWGDNSDLVVYMYHLLKFIMLFKRQLLIDNGISNPVLRGTDLEPIPDYMPTFIFRRSLLISGSIENYFDDAEFRKIFYEVDSVVLNQHLYESDQQIIEREKNKHE